MKNLPLLLGTVIGTLVLVFVVAVLFSHSNDSSKAVSADIAEIQGEQRHVIGTESSTSSAQTITTDPADALPSSQASDSSVETADEIVITEFSDFQCPACAQTAPALKSILEKYQGNVVLNYRHYPLVSIHSYAQIAAQASEVAAEFGLFWEFHDMLFSRQADWTVLESQNEVVERLSAYATELGIDSTIFLERIQADEIKAKVLADVQAGNRLNISGTPTLYVNDRQVSSAQKELTAALDDLITR